MPAAEETPHSPLSAAVSQRLAEIEGLAEPEDKARMVGAFLLELQGQVERVTRVRDKALMVIIKDDDGRNSRMLAEDFNVSRQRVDQLRARVVAEMRREAEVARARAAAAADGPAVSAGGDEQPGM